MPHRSPRPTCSGLVGLVLLGAATVAAPAASAEDTEPVTTVTAEDPAGDVEPNSGLSRRVLRATDVLGTTVTVDRAAQTVSGSVQLHERAHPDELKPRWLIGLVVKDGKDVYSAYLNPRSGRFAFEGPDGGDCDVAYVDGAITLPTSCLGDTTEARMTVSVLVERRSGGDLAFDQGTRTERLSLATDASTGGTARPASRTSGKHA